MSVPDGVDWRTLGELLADPECEGKRFLAEERVREGLKPVVERLERIRDLDEQTSDGALGSLARHALADLAALGSHPVVSLNPCEAGELFALWLCHGMQPPEIHPSHPLYTGAQKLGQMGCGCEGVAHKRPETKPGGLTTDPEEARNSPIRSDGQQETYVVLSADERAKGFVRPVRLRYRHVGRPGPRFDLVDLTDEQRERHSDCAYVKFEPYPESEHPTTGRYWTQEQLDAIDCGCGTVTTMATEIAETYARNPGFYGGTFCAGCGTHLPVGTDGEFVWEGTEERVGT